MSEPGWGFINQYCVMCCMRPQMVVLALLLAARNRFAARNEWAAKPIRAVLAEVRG